MSLEYPNHVIGIISHTHKRKSIQFLVFPTPSTNLSVRVQMAARAPFVFVFQVFIRKGTPERKDSRRKSDVGVRRHFESTHKNCLNYQFWKVRMKIFVESLEKGFWDAIENGPFIPKFEKDGSSIEKPWSQWTDSENKKAKFDCIAKNIITSTLNSDDFFRISQCSSAKEMWDTLEVTHEGI